MKCVVCKNDCDRVATVECDSSWCDEKIKDVCDLCIVGSLLLCDKCKNRKCDVCFERQATDSLGCGGCAGDAGTPRLCFKCCRLGVIGPLFTRCTSCRKCHFCGAPGTTGFMCTSPSGQSKRHIATIACVACFDAHPEETKTAVCFWCHVD
jgi:hypothetical protein